MPLELFTPSKDHAPHISHLAFAAFSTNPLTSLFYSIPAAPELISNYTAKLLSGWGTDPAEHMLCARDTSLPTPAQPSGEMVSWAHWFVERAKDGADASWAEFKAGPAPEGWNREWFTEFHRLDWEARVRTMGGQAHVYFQSLATPPPHRRRGAAALLTQAMIDFARAANLPVYLTASPAGAPLYRKLGFVEKGSYEIDVPGASVEQKTNLCMTIPAPRPEQPPSLPPRIVPTTTLEDFVTFMQIHDVAMRSSEVIGLAFGLGNGGLGGLTHEQRAQQELDAIAESEKPENRNRYGFLHHRAVDVLSGKTLSGAKWYFARDPKSRHHPFGEGWPPGSNVALCEAAFGEMNRRRERRMEGQQYALMCLLYVAPEAQRKGVGTALLKEGLKVVDGLGWKTWIDATQFGLGLYKKLGWVEVERVVTDLKEYGGRGVDTSVSLLREPGAEEKAVAS